MEPIPLDFNKLFELYNSFEISKNTEKSTIVDIVNGLIYSNKILNGKDLNKLKQIKSLTYDSEELKKLFVSQQIKNYLIQELLKIFLEKQNKEQDTENKEQNIKLTNTTYSKSSIDLIKLAQQSFDKHIEHLNKQDDFYDKIEQIISSFNQLKIKYNL